jgi:hypothetical protein
MPLWLCATPRIADAVEQLGAQRRALIEARSKSKASP